MRFIFTTSPDLFSAAIRGFDSGGVSHVGMQLERQPQYVVDTTWTHGGVKMWDTREFETMHRRRVVHRIDLPLPHEATAAQWLIQQMGKPYDYSAIFGMAMLRDWQDERAWNCFELAMATALHGGLPLLGRYSEIGGRLCLETINAWRTGLMAHTITRTSHDGT